MRSPGWELPVLYTIQPHRCHASPPAFKIFTPSLPRCTRVFRCMCCVIDVDVLSGDNQHMDFEQLEVSVMNSAAKRGFFDDR